MYLNRIFNPRTSENIYNNGRIRHDVLHTTTDFELIFTQDEAIRVHFSINIREFYENLISVCPLSDPKYIKPN